MFTPKYRLEQFRQYTNRKKNKIDITELISGAEVAQNGWADKETEIQHDFLIGYRPSGILPDDTGRVQNQTGRTG